MRGPGLVYLANFIEDEMVLVSDHLFFKISFWLIWRETLKTIKQINKV